MLWVCISAVLRQMVRQFLSWICGAPKKQMETLFRAARSRVTVASWSWHLARATKEQQHITSEIEFDLRKISCVLLMFLNFLLSKCAFRSVNEIQFVSHTWRGAAVAHRAKVRVQVDRGKVPVTHPLMMEVWTKMPHARRYDRTCDERTQADDDLYFLAENLSQKKASYVTAGLRCAMAPLRSTDVLGQKCMCNTFPEL